MKKLLVILFLFSAVNVFAQQRDTVRIKIPRGGNGITSLANNSTGDSLVYYIGGVRHAIKVASQADLATGFVAQSFDTATRVLTMTRRDGTSQGVVIPKGTASGAEGIAALSSSRNENMVAVMGDNGTITSFSVTDFDSATRLHTTDTTAMLSPYQRTASAFSKSNADLLYKGINWFPSYSEITGTVPTWNQNTTGNAATATKLQTARAINGVSFDGSTNITIVDATKVSITDTSSMLAPYQRISNAFTRTIADGLYKPVGYVPTWTEIASKPTTMSGYGITDFNSLGDARWSLLSHVHTFASLTTKPTTLSGYGITDAYPLSGNPSGFLTSASITGKVNVSDTASMLSPYLRSATAASTYAVKSTTLAGYGITDAYTKTSVDAGLTTKANDNTVVHLSNYELVSSKYMNNSYVQLGNSDFGMSNLYEYNALTNADYKGKITISSPGGTATSSPRNMVDGTNAYVGLYVGTETSVTLTFSMNSTYTNFQWQPFVNFVNTSRARVIQVQTSLDSATWVSQSTWNGSDTTTAYFNYGTLWMGGIGTLDPPYQWKYVRFILSNFVLQANYIYITELGFRATSQEVAGRYIPAIGGDVYGALNFKNRVNGSGNFATFNPSTGALQERTPSQTLSDIGAAPLASPTFTGTPSSTTPALLDSSIRIATTEFVQKNAIVFKGAIPSGANLNNYRTSGWYSQESAAFADAGTNYPKSSAAGKLEVKFTSVDFGYQTYHIYGGSNTIYYRTFYAGTGWSAWKETADKDWATTAFAAKSTTLAGYGITDAITSAVAASTYVPKTTTINGKSLSSNITLTTTDIGAEPTIATKNTAFNKNFGRTTGTVMDGKEAIDSLALVNTRMKNLDASYITSGRLDTSHSPITRLYATDGISATSNSNGITFRADTSVWRLGGNNVLLHNDSAHWMGLEKNDTLKLRVHGGFGGVISYNGGNLSYGYDGMTQFFIDPSYVGQDNVNFGNAGQYNNLAGNRNTSGGNLSLTRNLSNDNTALGYRSLYSNKFGNKTVAIGLNSGASYSFNFENLQECTFLGTDAAPIDTWPTSTQMVRSIAIGKDAKVTKSYQTVIGSPETQETLIRGSVYANIAPRDSLIFTTTDTARLNLDTDNVLAIGSLANDLYIANPVGTLNNFKEIIYRIQSNGIAHALTFGTMFHFSTDLPAPTTTIASKRLYIRGYYNSSDNTIDVIQVLNNF